MENSRILGGPVRPVCVLQGVQYAALNVGQRLSLKTLHDDQSECYWPVIIQAGG